MNCLKSKIFRLNWHFDRFFFLSFFLYESQASLCCYRWSFVHFLSKWLFFVDDSWTFWCIRYQIHINWTIDSKYVSGVIFHFLTLLHRPNETDSVKVFSASKTKSKQSSNNNNKIWMGKYLVKCQLNWNWAIEVAIIFECILTNEYIIQFDAIGKLRCASEWGNRI